MMEYTMERLKQCLNLTEGTYEDIDKGMIPILIELNEKGYKTLDSCEGHVKNKEFDTYITFERNYDFPQVPVHSFSGKKDGGYKYEWCADKESDERAEEIRLMVLEYLMEFVKDLPKIETRYFMVGHKGKRKNWLGKKITKDEVERIKKETAGKYDWYDVWGIDIKK